MEERAISPAESLQIIERMLRETRNRFYNNEFAFLFCGVLIIAACLMGYIADRAGYNGLDGYIWSIAIGLGIIVTAVYYVRIAPQEAAVYPAGQHQWKGLDCLWYQLYGADVFVRSLRAVCAAVHLLPFGHGDVRHRRYL